MTLSGMGPSLAVEGATTRAVFEAHVEKALAPSLRAGQVVVMDNLSAHKGEDQEAHRGEEPRAGLPAALLAGPQPHRAGLLQAQGAAARGRGPQPRGPDRGDGGGAIGGHRPGCIGLLQILRLPLPGPTTVRGALDGKEEEPPNSNTRVVDSR